MAGKIDAYLQGTSQANEIGNAYWTCRDGIRYMVTHQTIGTNITGQTSFVDTTPTFFIRNNQTTNRLILSNFSLSQTGTVAGGEITIAQVLDTADRNSTPGTLVVPQNTNGESTDTAGFTFQTNPTTTAAGGGTRVVETEDIAAQVGAVYAPDWRDGIIIPANGSFLVYTFAATTGPSWKFTFEVVEELL